jgi:hypothetical protein
MPLCYFIYSLNGLLLGVLYNPLNYKANSEDFESLLSHRSHIIYPLNKGLRDSLNILFVKVLIVGEDAAKGHRKLLKEVNLGAPAGPVN